MPDRGKVITKFELFIKEFELFIKELYPACTSEGVELNMFREVLALLKEQEAVEARKEDDGTPQPCTSWWYVCGACGQEIEYHDRYCCWCGRAVKWNE